LGIFDKSKKYEQNITCINTTYYFLGVYASAKYPNKFEEKNHQIFF